MHGVEDGWLSGTDEGCGFHGLVSLTVDLNGLVSVDDWL